MTSKGLICIHRSLVLIFNSTYWMHHRCLDRVVVPIVRTPGSKHVLLVLNRVFEICQRGHAAWSIDIQGYISYLIELSFRDNVRINRRELT
jgi:hypothetical protein